MFRIFESTNRTTVAAALAVILAATANAQPAPQFDLDWYTIDGGGQMFSTSREMELGGTIAQHDAVQTLSGGGFQLVGGFWPVSLIVEAPPCPGDLDQDGDVDIGDLTQLLSHFGMVAGATPADGDLDGDTDVDITDLAALLSNFGVSCG